MKFQLEYKGKFYIVEDKLITDEEEREIPYIWDEGNYACDCNRSQFIQESQEEDFPEMPCGHKIKLIGIVKK